MKQSSIRPDKPTSFLALFAIREPRNGGPDAIKEKSVVAGKPMQNASVQLAEANTYRCRAKMPWLACEQEDVQFRKPR